MEFLDEPGRAWSYCQHATSGGSSDDCSGVGNSESIPLVLVRAYFLRKLRADTFDNMIRSWIVRVFQEAGIVPTQVPASSPQVLKIGRQLLKASNAVLSARFKPASSKLPRPTNGDEVYDSCLVFLTPPPFLPSTLKNAETCAGAAIGMTFSGERYDVALRSGAMAVKLSQECVPDSVEVAFALQGLAQAQHCTTDPDLALQNCHRALKLLELLAPTSPLIASVWSLDSDRDSCTNNGTGIREICTSQRTVRRRRWRV